LDLRRGSNWLQSCPLGPWCYAPGASFFLVGGQRPPSSAGSEFRLASPTHRRKVRRLPLGRRRLSARFASLADCAADVRWFSRPHSVCAPAARKGACSPAVLGPCVA